MMGLTERQAELLAFLKSYAKEKSLAPNFDEMAAHMHLKSKSNIHSLLTDLEQRGHIRRHKHKRRAIEVVDPAEQETVLQIFPPDIKDWLLKESIREGVPVSTIIRERIRELAEHATDYAEAAA